MSDSRLFIVAQSQGEDCARLACKTRIRPDQSELEGARFGQRLLDNASTSFLRGLHQLFCEAETTEKIGLGY